MPPEKKPLTIEEYEAAMYDLRWDVWRKLELLAKRLELASYEDAARATREKWLLIVGMRNSDCAYCAYGRKLNKPDICAECPVQELCGVRLTLSADEVLARIPST